MILLSQRLRRSRQNENLFAMEFEIKDLGSLKYFLGKGEAIPKEEIAISQRKYTLDSLKEVGMLGCKLGNPPM